MGEVVYLKKDTTKFESFVQEHRDEFPECPVFTREQALEHLDSPWQFKELLEKREVLEVGENLFMANMFFA